MASAIPILEKVSISEDGSTSMDLRGWTPEDIVYTLTKVFDSLIDVSSITAGMEPAFQDAYQSVMMMQKQFPTQFNELNIGDYILKGALRSKLPSGLETLDVALDGGIPKGSTVMILGPSGSAKYLLAYHFLARGLKDGASCIATTSIIDASTFRNWLSRLKLKAVTYEEKGLLKIVDWYSYKKGNIVGVEEDGAVYLASKDIANLDIAMSNAVDGLKFAPTKRAVIDIITPALAIYDLPIVSEIVQKHKAKLKKAGFTSVIIVEKEAHDERTLTTLKQVSDGVISIVKGGDGELSIQIQSMTGSTFDSKPLPIKVMKSGLSIVSRRVAESVVLKDFTDIPAVTEDIARNMYESGFTEIDKLEKITQPELLEIAGIDKQAAKQIYDYVNSVKYTKKVLARNSDKWLRKGAEFHEVGKIEKAIQCFQRAIEINADNAKAWFELARLLYDEGNVEDSKKCFEKAKAIDPSLADSWFDSSDKDIQAKCPACGMAFKEEHASCPNCGVVFTLEERKRFGGQV